MGYPLTEEKVHAENISNRFPVGIYIHIKLLGGFAIAKALTHKKKISCNEMSNLIRLRKINQ